ASLRAGSRGDGPGWGNALPPGLKSGLASGPAVRHIAACTSREHGEHLAQVRVVGDVLRQRWNEPEDFLDGAQHGPVMIVGGILVAIPSGERRQDDHPDRTIADL